MSWYVAHVLDVLDYSELDADTAWKKFNNQSKAYRSEKSLEK